MTKSITKHPVDWSVLMTQLGAEFAVLPEEERAWLAARSSAISRLQQSLDDLFQKAGGLQACADCDGECCGCGRHHLTLVNIVAFLLEDTLPPTPDFDRTCPFLGQMGCLLPVAKRPYNCITFFCELLEECLDEGAREELRSLDRQLRAEYELVEQRYTVATLRGMWVGLERVSMHDLLQRRDEEVVQ